MTLEYRNNTRYRRGGGFTRSGDAGFSDLIEELPKILNANNFKYDYTKGKREASFTEDKDWLAAKDILVKTFPESFISTLRLGEKRFMKLCELLLDKSFDLDKYAKWVKSEKMPRVNFSWSIFLLSSMLDEYRIVAADLKESTKHLHTNSKEARARHAKAAEKSEEWIRNTIMKKEAKNGSKKKT